VTLFSLGSKKWRPGDQVLMSHQSKKDVANGVKKADVAVGRSGRLLQVQEETRVGERRSVEP